MTHTYICVLERGGGGGEKRECKKLDIISNRESEILLSRISLLGGGKLRIDFDHLMYMYHVLISSMELPFLKKMWTQIQSIKQAFKWFLQIIDMYFHS